mmetsp:Transcript_325/g.1003  ORF Transcript_325/g.1003 Transcript_325/m.1003 type:complete len:111 (-) Transcript_325:377-709(-)
MKSIDGCAFVWRRSIPPILHLHGCMNLLVMDTYPPLAGRGLSLFEVPVCDIGLSVARHAIASLLVLFLPSARACRKAAARLPSGAARVAPLLPPHLASFSASARPSDFMV